ncbi:hypothetical protein [Tessaracoccus caeni]|uniref:hypothetical protein n=1 Tax=Tessaracoccus caeni TaxID=3031239 RepID=UPI0023DC7DE6|nr:hypothetical protein [Tessaracoccus caeni]MDF1488020.1 hypothetical protein [Tessaracoccus caeni]
MGIRYYAYAFDRNDTEQALANPRDFLSDDPLADAWGLPHGFTVAHGLYEQAVPKCDMLYLDKAWRYFQLVTSPPSPEHTSRAAYRMFEGNVTFADPLTGYDRWVRPIPPDDVVEIALDLNKITPEQFAGLLRPHIDNWHVKEEDIDYAVSYLPRAQEYMTGLVETDRGFVYTIG